MPISHDGTTVFRIGEALKLASVSRATYFRWVREGRITDARYRDRNGRRVLTQRELDELVDEAHRLVDVTVHAKEQLRLELAR